MAEFKHQLEKNSLVSVEMLDKMTNPYYFSGGPILPGDRVLVGCMWIPNDDGIDELELIKFHETEIDTVYTIKDTKQYVPVLCKI